MDFSELSQCEVRGTDLSARIGLIANDLQKRRTSASVLVFVSPGTLGISSFLGKEDKKMYWYNPKARTSERVEEPSTDEQAIQMLAGTRDSAEFIKEYYKLRRSGTPIEQALVLVGHEFRLRQMDYHLALR